MTVSGIVRARFMDRRRANNNLHVQAGFLRNQSNRNPFRAKSTSVERHSLHPGASKT